ncbi:MAG: hypothetical protein COX65_02005 [Elusimicrobia bacterium CG_4_10_14_0_2_um_filter_56_8]|nr:MAG: hypothetical protein AUJ51_03985 [Elusimicrobia bacterium CG1_02_56_21]PJA16676.1 MAG: hypothetical protein COX65_02005 [Elusimicrobia bacterium CG_4_10_14_0_2_um_filter_56_8]
MEGGQNRGRARLKLGERQPAINKTTLAYCRPGRGRKLVDAAGINGTVKTLNPPRSGTRPEQRRSSAQAQPQYPPRPAA